MTDLALLRRAAERARANRFFLASALLDYAEVENMDDERLARYLGCAPEQLPMILLCRRPTGVGPAFAADVRRIADRFGADTERLVQVLRVADVLDAYAAQPGSAFLAAARDREEVPPEESEPDPQEPAP